MTPHKEDYLKCINEILNQDEKVTNKLVANLMNVSAPAVTEMLRKLLADNLIQKDAISGYKLTKEGLFIVSKLIRKHRLLEVFLMNKLGYSTEEVHEEAEILEHNISDIFVDRLEKLLDYPKLCPHGSPIPPKDKLLNEKLIPINVGLTDREYIVKKISNNQDLSLYIKKLGIKINSSLKIIEKDLVAEITKVLLADKEIILSNIIASQILVIKK